MFNVYEIRILFNYLIFICVFSLFLKFPLCVLFPVNFCYILVISVSCFYVFFIIVCFVFLLICVVLFSDDFLSIFFYSINSRYLFFISVNLHCFYLHLFWLFVLFFS